MYVMGISARKMEEVAGVPPSALRRREVRPPVARRHLRQVPGRRPLGLPSRRDRHRARRHGPQALPGRGLRRHRVPRRLEGVPVRPARPRRGRRRGRGAARGVGRPRRARVGDSRDVPMGGLAALRHAPDAQRRRPRPQEGGPEDRARGDEGRLRPEEPARGAGALPEGGRGGREAVAVGGRGPAGGGGGSRLPGLPRVAQDQDPHRQRAGAGRPRDQAAHQRRAGLPFARVPHPLGGRGAHRGRRGAVGELRHLEAVACPRMEKSRGIDAERGVHARCKAGRRRDNLGGD